jgi:hypothetical protein
MVDPEAGAGGTQAPEVGEGPASAALDPAEQRRRDEIAASVRREIEQWAERRLRRALWLAAGAGAVALFLLFPLALRLAVETQLAPEIAEANRNATLAQETAREALEAVESAQVRAEAAAGQVEAIDAKLRELLARVQEQSESLEAESENLRFLAQQDFDELLFRVDSLRDLVADLSPGSPEAQGMLAQHEQALDAFEATTTPARERLHDHARVRVRVFFETQHGDAATAIVDALRGEGFKVSAAERGGAGEAQSPAAIDPLAADERLASPRAADRSVIFYAPEMRSLAEDLARRLVRYGPFETSEMLAFSDGASPAGAELTISLAGRR